MRIRRIDPYRFYSTAELREVLRGSIKIDTLKDYGLVGLAAGYWGGNVIFAIDRYCRTLITERGPCSSGKEQEHGAIIEKEDHLEDRKMAGHRRTRQLEHPQRRDALLAPGGRRGKLETLVSEYDRLRAEAEQEMAPGVRSGRGRDQG